MLSLKLTGRMSRRGRLMKRSNGMIVCVLFFSVVLLLVAVSVSSAEEGDRLYDFGAGIGMNFNSQNIRQGLVYAGIGWDSERYDFLCYRIEGALDLIGNSKTLVIGTIMPVFRFYVSTGSAWRPFFDIGAGVSLKDGDLVGGQHLDGPIVFSLMDGIGVEYRTAGDQRFSISTRFKHISNSGFYERNQGVNAQYIVFSAGF